MHRLIVIFSVSIAAVSSVLAITPTAKDMRGPFPIMSTPNFAGGAIDCEVLAKELVWTAESGCHGVIWCQSNAAFDLLTTEEKFKGFEACAQAEPRELVDYILYLRSENGRCVTGSNHVMDCGRLTMKPQ